MMCGVCLTSASIAFLSPPRCTTDASRRRMSCGLDVAAPLIRRRLPKALLDFDPQHFGYIVARHAQVLPQSAADIASQQFRRRVLDRQEHAILAREHPLAIPVAYANAPGQLLQQDYAILRR